MNPTLRDVIKQELQKLSDANFIYPIFDSEWVSPLSIATKKNGKFQIYLDYSNLNKETHKYHFPSSFIHQVLDKLLGKKYLSSMDLVDIIRYISLCKTRAR